MQIDEIRVEFRVGGIRDGCQYIHMLWFLEKRLGECYHSSYDSQGVIQHLCLVGMVRELRGMFEVSLEVQQNILFGKNFFRLRAYHFRSFKSFLFSIFISWFCHWEGNCLIAILTLTMLMLFLMHLWIFNMKLLNLRGRHSQ